MPKPTALDPLQLFELSLVDAPANKDSKVTIFKREQDMEDDDMERIEQLEGEICDLSAKVDDLTKKLNAATNKRSEERAPPVKKSFDELVGAIRKRDNCSATDALRKARQASPEAYDEFQQSAGNAGDLPKQKAISKAQAEFAEIVAEIRSVEKCSATEALTLARKQYPAKFEAYNAN
jgi:uncharacterized coiled-coil DUF342 family protein